MRSLALCECCRTNSRKSATAKYCASCSDYICRTVLVRANKIDARYKKVYKTMFRKLHSLTKEDPFIPRQIREMMEMEEVKRG